MIERETYTVIVHREDGVYWAEVAELPGCFASGDTLGELEDGLAEAVLLCRAPSPVPGGSVGPLRFDSDAKADVSMGSLTVV